MLFRMRAHVADLISGSPALRSVLGHISERTGLDPRERHRLENEALARRHEREKIALEGQKKALDKIDRRERVSLERDLKREALMERTKKKEKRAAEDKDKVRVQRTDPRLLDEGALGQEFNAEARASQGESADDGDGDDGGDLRKSWKQRADEIGQRRGRGCGFKMERDGD
ncbi:hypothetical protein C8D95_1182 [Silicimonas algicola]|uniref:Uncharacterized protein n=2 Tax=Silicimonas algicola TaxID=1826607 RepID=A0A316FST6_9RHOB|nr:hypothetical protein C8D95_1182 [Silicimonas algicola]